MIHEQADLITDEDQNLYNDHQYYAKVKQKVPEGERAVTHKTGMCKPQSHWGNNYEVRLAL